MAKVTLGIRVDAAEKEVLEKLADELGMKSPDLVRTALEIVGGFDLEFLKEIIRISENNKISAFSYTGLVTPETSSVLANIFSAWEV